MFKHACAYVFLIFLSAAAAHAQTAPASAPAPAPAPPVRILPPEQTIKELRAYLLPRVPKFAMPNDPQAWTTESERLRKRMLDEVVLAGVPAAWQNAPLNVVWGATVPGKGYTIRKLRYEVVPGLWVGALLYEPEKLEGKVPAILNVNGHVGGPGMSQDYEQIRRINLAKRGMLALGLEWIGMGQLGADGYSHHGAAYLELCGISGVSIHYLELKRGLDILLQHASADPERVALTGLSGGGWQTIFLSSLDTRIKLAAPNAGYVGFASRVLNRPDMGDEEQSPTDMGTVADYVHLTAMLAPRFALSIANAKDNCCFPADRVRTFVYEPIIPVYALYGKPERLAFHVNEDPGTHNYDKDNRQAFYRFVNRHFLPEAQRKDDEIPIDGEMRTQAELSIEYLPDNGSYHTLAAQAMQTLPTSTAPANDAAAVESWAKGTRESLRKVIRLSGAATQPVSAPESDAKVPAPSGAKTQSRLLKIADRWTLPIVIHEPDAAAGTTLILADGGRDSVADLVNKAVQARQRTVVADLLLTGECNRVEPAPYLWSLLIAALGQRSLGIQVEQLQAVLGFIESDQVKRPVQIITRGRMSGLAALVLAALEPQRVTRIELHQMDRSLKDLLAKKVDGTAAPSVFCTGLLKVADIPNLIDLARPTQIDRVAD